MIGNALKELKELQSIDSCTMDVINWWLLKYQDDYDYINNTWSCRKCPTTAIGLPCLCTIKQKEYIFLKTFESLDLLTASYKREGYFRQQLLNYQNIKDKGIRLREWLLTHPELDHSEFYSNRGYIDYDEDDYGKIYIPEDFEIPIVLDIKTYFKYQIRFTESFEAYMYYKDNYDEYEILQENEDPVLIDIKKLQLPLRTFFFENQRTA